MGGYGALRKPLGEHTSHLPSRLALRTMRSMLMHDASDVLMEEEGDYSRALLALTYVWDTRDSQYLARRGHRVSDRG